MWLSRTANFSVFAGGFLISQFSSVQFSKNISIAQLSRMSHCAPEATLNPIRLLKFTPKTVVTCKKCLRRASVLAGCSRHVARQQQSSCHQMCCVTCVRGTAHDLSVDERSRRLGPSETKCMSSVKYGGSLPDNDEKTKHASVSVLAKKSFSDLHHRVSDQCYCLKTTLTSVTNSAATVATGSTPVNIVININVNLEK